MKRKLSSSGVTLNVQRVRYGDGLLLELECDFCKPNVPIALRTIESRGNSIK